MRNTTIIRLSYISNFIDFYAPKLPLLLSLYREMEASLAEKPHLAIGIEWLDGYNEPLFRALGLDQIDLTKEPTPVEKQTFEQTTQDIADSMEAEGVTLNDLLPFLRVMYCNITSLAYFSQSMYALLQKAAAGDKRALLMAVRIEPAILATPAAKAIIQYAALTDQRLFNQIGLAAGKRSVKQSNPHLDAARFFTAVFKQAGLLIGVSTTKLATLYTEKGLYSGDFSALESTLKRVRKLNPVLQNTFLVTG